MQATIETAHTTDTIYFMALFGCLIDIKQHTEGIRFRDMTTEQLEWLLSDFRCGMGAIERLLTSAKEPPSPAMPIRP